MAQDAYNLLLQVIGNSPTGQQLASLDSLDGSELFLVFKAGEKRPYIVTKDKINFQGEVPDSILDFADTPGSFTGQKGKILVVKEDEKGFEYQVLAEVQGVSEQQLNDAVAELEAKIDANGSSSPTELISFTLGWQSGLIFDPSAEWKYNGVLDSDTRQITASAADATYDRIDKFAVDLNLGQIILLEGVPSANPSEPEIDPVTQLEGPIILIKAGATAPDGISGNIIWDEGGSGNWDASNAGPDFDLQSTTSPKSGTYAIEAIGLLTDGQSLPFSAPSPIPVEEFKELQFAIKNKTSGTFQVLISGNKSNGRPANQWLDAPTTFDPNNTSTYQDISLAMPYMSIVEVTKISIVSRTEGWQYHLDDVRYISGTETVTSGVNKEYVDQGDAELQAQIDDHEQRIQTLEGGSTTSPSGHHENKYADVASMLADQANQTEGSLQFVTDASGWSTVDSGWAEFEKLATSNGAEADYRKDSEEESMDSLTEKSLKETERAFTAKQNFDGGATAPTPVNPTDDSKEVVNVEYLHGKLADAGGVTVISNITPLTANYLLTSASNNAILRVKDYASVIVPSGLGLKHRTVIKKATGKTVSLTWEENVVLEIPEGYAAEILAQNDAIEIVCEEITNGVEYWGVYGALGEGGNNLLPISVDISDTSLEGPTLLFPITYKSSDWPEITTTKDYFVIYSSDHSVTDGGIYWGEMDDPEGSGFVERGVLFTSPTFETETPFLLRVPSAESGIADELFLYMHTNDQDTRNTTGQETHLYTTSGGAELHNCTWNYQGKPLGQLSGENHTGYFVPMKRGDGDYIGYHSVKNTGEFGVSTSTDGLSWTRLINEVSPTQGMPSGHQMPTRPRIFPFERNGTTYGFVAYEDLGETKFHAGYLGIFELDANYMPQTFVKKIADFTVCDGMMYVENDMAYLATWETQLEAIGVFKYYIPHAV